MIYIHSQLYKRKTVATINQSIRIGRKRLSETPSNRKKSFEGFPVGLFVRYGLMTRLVRGDPLF